MSGLKWMTRIPIRLILTFDIRWSFTKDDNLAWIDSWFPLLPDFVVFN